MTQEDYATLARWQAPNDGKVARSIYELSTALGGIEECVRNRDGARLVRDEYYRDIHGIAVRLNILMLLLAPKQHNASEIAA